MIPMTATFRGMPVFFEATMAATYDDEAEVTVFENRNGQLFMHDAKIGDLADIGPEQDPQS